MTLIDPLATLEEAVTALPQAAYLVDAVGRIVAHNQAAEKLWGRIPDPDRDRYCGSHRLFMADGTPLAHDDCPMAHALREGEPVSGIDAIAERPDGTRVRFSPCITPVRATDGAVAGALNVMSWQPPSHDAPEVRSWHLSAIVESSQDAILSKDLDGIITSWNAAASTLFGYDAAEAIGRPVTMLIPPDRQDEEPSILERVRRGVRVFPYETVRQRKDGSLVDISLSVSPILSPDGRVVGASKIARDITAKRDAEVRQQMLVREMAHRVRNAYTLVGAVASLCAREAQSVGAFREDLQGRLEALASAHELTLRPSGGTSGDTSDAAAFDDLVQLLLKAYAGKDGDARVTISGDPLRVNHSDASALSMLVYELATNSAKHGALSVASGRVDILCTRQTGEWRVRWCERGGPPVATRETDRGFGSRLMRHLVENQLGGRLTMEWSSWGLTAICTFPDGGEP